VTFYANGEFLSSFIVVGYTDELATLWATTMHEARRAGRRLEAGDAWIAATARLLNAPLLTHDKDFSPAACPSITVHCYAK
jgi:predicted nucleic acid-binding protein